jgi:Fur family peroxide stress response transcriptional regulator
MVLQEARARVAVPASEVEKRVSLFSAALRESGLRLTHQRLQVAREIAGDESHPDVETVYLGVRERVPTISLDTVYRTVAALVELGLVNRVNATAGPTRYDANTVLHHHFVCTRCGLIRDVYSTSLDSIQVPDETSVLGTIESVKVQLRGVCNECKRKETSGER